MRREIGGVTIGSKDEGRLNHVENRHRQRMRAKDRELEYLKKCGLAATHNLDFWITSLVDGVHKRDAKRLKVQYMFATFLKPSLEARKVGERIGIRITGKRSKGPARWGFITEWRRDAYFDREGRPISEYEFKDLNIPKPQPIGDWLAEPFEPTLWNQCKQWLGGET